MSWRLRQLNRIDTGLAVAIFGLSLFGLLMLYSASSELSRQTTGSSANSTHYLVLQMASFVVGMIGWVVMQQIDYRTYKNRRTLWLVTTLILLSLVLIFSKGAVNGAHRWVSIGGQTFQPSEFAKLTFILFLGSWFSDRHSSLQDWKKSFVPFMAIVGVISLLMLKERDLGSLGVMISIALAMYVMSGARLSHLAASLATLGFFGWLSIKLVPYRMQRLLSFLNADASPQGAGYHINQAKIAIGLGGMWGKGFLQGTQKKGFLPEAHTDSIFSVIVEELGFLRSSLVVLVFMYIGLRGMRIARLAPDHFGTLIATGITTWFCGQAFINIAAMASLIPLTGVPLPFISYGRTALVAMFVATGILLNISRYAREE